MYALILAGGQGTRLWPRSRRSLPKQLLDLTSERTMLQETCDRLDGIVAPQDTYVITSADYAPETQRQLPNLPAANIVIEPEGRNTAPAIGLGIAHIAARDPEAVVAVLSADHVVLNREAFAQAMDEGQRQAQAGYLVTVGIVPTRPETGYGYIELGEEVAGSNGRAYVVRRFREKPDAETAQLFVEHGQHLWNAGMFLWRTDAILEALRRHLPDLAQRLEAISAAIGSDRQQAVLEDQWQGVQPISIDFGVMEAHDRVAVVPADLGWSDVGSWASLADLLPADDDGNVVLGAGHICTDTVGTLVYGGKRLIAAIGLSDLVVVDTDDVLLICPKNRAQDVKQIVDRLNAEGRTEYL